MTIVALIENDTSSSAVVVVAIFAAVAIFSIVALTSKGRRSLLPLLVVLLGVAIALGAITDAKEFRISPITFIGLFFSLLLIIGGLGAFREGVALPPVEGKDPEIEPAPPRVVPKG